MESLKKFYGAAKSKKMDPSSVVRADEVFSAASRGAKKIGSSSAVQSAIKRAMGKPRKPSYWKYKKLDKESVVREDEY